MEAVLGLMALVLVFQLGAVVCLRQSPKAVRSLCYRGLAFADAAEKLQHARTRIALERHRMFQSLDQGGAQGEPVELMAIRFESGREVEGNEPRRIHRP